MAVLGDYSPVQETFLSLGAYYGEINDSISLSRDKHRYLARARQDVVIEQLLHPEASLIRGTGVSLKHPDPEEEVTTGEAGSEARAW